MVKVTVMTTTISLRVLTMTMTMTMTNDNHVHIMMARLTPTSAITHSDNEFGGHNDDDDNGDGKYNSDVNCDGDEYALALTMVTGRLLIRPYTLMTMMFLTLTMTMLINDA